MKMFTGFVCWLALVAFTLSAHPFEGDWQFIKGEYKTKNGEILTADHSTLVAIKSVKGNKFAISNMQQGAFLGFLAGDFTMDGEHYSEHVKTGSKAHIGHVYTFEGWLETKTENGVNIVYWHHKGRVNDVDETEVWRKLSN